MLPFFLTYDHFSSSSVNQKFYPFSVLVPTHSYYSRPRFGAKRSHEDSADGSTAVLDRQRSVSFAAPPGTAPGDTASEATTLEYDADSILRGSSTSNCPLAIDSGGTDTQCSPVEYLEDADG